MDEKKIDELIVYEKKNLRLARIRTIFCILMAVAVVVFSVAAVVEIKTVDTAISELSEIVKTEINTLDMEGVNQAIQKLTEAAGTLSEVDITAINKLVSELETVASSLAGAANAIKGIFGR